jgi:UDP-N-acetylmuramoyl-L-alanyl-D-glutamate--2,6-diaminopimelate ligase
MGEVAGLGSDVAVVTSDNPRSERPMAIIEEILDGVRRAGREETDPALGPAARGYAVIENRAEAIRAAIGLAAGGDVVLIAGKGHEDYQTLADRTVRHDDREVAAAALAERVSLYSQTPSERGRAG